jgi:hypothetical protein
VENNIQATDDLSSLPLEVVKYGVHVFPTIPKLTYECMRRGVSKFLNRELMYMFGILAKHTEFVHALEFMDAIAQECLHRGLEKFSSRDLSFLCESLGDAYDVIHNDAFVRQVVAECNRRGPNEFSVMQRRRIERLVAKVTTSVGKE